MDEGAARGRGVCHGGTEGTPLGPHCCAAICFGRRTWRADNTRTGIQCTCAVHVRPPRPRGHAQLVDVPALLARHAGPLGVARTRLKVPTRSQHPQRQRQACTHTLRSGRGGGAHSWAVTERQAACTTQSWQQNATPERTARPMASPSVFGPAPTLPSSAASATAAPDNGHAP